ncbi:MAG: hypothetical protein J6L24_02740 [Oscillospiraceae bacterium]|nr:hypothetical protein [Oscillospiraceae bacterium]
MKKHKSASSTKRRKRLASNVLKIICLILVPIVIAVLLILDAFDVYIFSRERLLVLGIGLLIILLPFFSEISLKGLTVKQDPTNGKK